MITEDMLQIMHETNKAFIELTSFFELPSSTKLPEAVEIIKAKVERLQRVITDASTELTNLQPHIGQLLEQERPFIDGHVDIALDILEHKLTGEEVCAKYQLLGLTKGRLPRKTK
jgi:hypothetical protein